MSGTLCLLLSDYFVWDCVVWEYFATWDCFVCDSFVWDFFVCFYRTILSGTVLSGNILQLGTVLSGTVLYGHGLELGLNCRQVSCTMIELPIINLEGEIQGCSDVSGS